MTVTESAPFETNGKRPRSYLGIYADLKNEIAAGNFTDGTRLVEAELAERFAVSRTPIRQALLALEQDGLVARDGRGLHLRAQTAAEVMELYEVRELLEERAARLAARRHDESDEVVLNHILGGMEATPEPDRYARNREFHRAVWRASHQLALQRTLERAYIPSIYGLDESLTGPSRWVETVAEHREMVSAILGSDEDRSGALVVQHLRAARDIRIRASLSHSV
jgi:DNA-binding GntR family transcriptional regulator